MYYHFFLEKDFSPFISAYLIFNLLFFIIAPLSQIHSETNIYVNDLPYNWGEAIKANCYILLFNLVFIISYVVLKNEQKKVPIYKINKTLPFNILLILVICILIFIFNLDYIQEKLMTPTWKLQYDNKKSIKIIISKVLFSVPLAGVAMCVMYFKKKKKNAINWLIILISICVFLLLIVIFKNPFMEKRSGLGPIYFCLLFLFIPKLLNSNIKTTFVLYFSLIVLMPLLAIFTHINSSFSEVVNKPSLLLKSLHGDVLFSNFDTLNFDAYANFLATIEYVSVKGFCLGEQLTSAFFFFIPRSIWKSKPHTTGQLIGDYLIENHGFWVSV